MEFDTTSHRDLEMPLEEPHFDEEATLLSAQPVVPLQEIATRERSGKRLMFGVAIVFSLIVGALGGALIYKQRTAKQSPASLDAAVSGAEGITIDEPVPAPSVAESVAEAGSGTLPERSAVPAEKLSTHGRPIASSRIETKEKLPNQADDRDLAWEERVQEWRRRRKLEREAQKDARRRRDRSDDVLRIREIFEGSRRPE